MKRRDDSDPMESFSLHEFKRWMSEHATSQFALHPADRKGIGLLVEPRVSQRRLLARMEPEQGDAESLAREFRERGGRLVEIDGALFLVEVDGGSFVIPRSCVRRRDG